MNAPSELEPSEIDWKLRLDHEARGLVHNARDEVLKFRSAIELVESSFKLSEIARNQILENMNLRTALQRQMQKHRHWSIIGAHAAISSLFQFQDTLSALNEWVSKRADDDSVFADKNAAGSALDLFNKRFPKWKQTRHATAHSSEILRNSSKNAHTGKLDTSFIRKDRGVELMTSGTFFGRVFNTTRKGEILEFDTSWTNYVSLVEIHDLAISGFAKSQKSA